MPEYRRVSAEIDGNTVRKAVPQEVPLRVRKKDLKAEKKRKQNLIRITEKQIRKSRLAGVNSKSAVATIALVVLFFGMMFGLFFGKVKLTNLYSNIEAKQEELAQLQSLQVQLEMEMTSDKSSSELEKYAKSVLGMTKATSDQTYYVNLTGGDTAVIEEEESSGVLERLWKTICSWF